MPGNIVLHWISSYPTLAARNAIPVNAGGVGNERNDNVLCIGNDSTFTMLDKYWK